MSVGLLDVPVKLDAEGRIAGDLPCLHCGYLLRMQSPQGHCPECGRSVHETTRLSLACAEPRWLMKLIWAMTLAIVAVVLGSVMMVIAFGIMGWISIYGRQISPDALRLAKIYLFLGPWLPIGVGLAACLLFTSPEPPGLGREVITDSKRQLARWSAVFLVLFGACAELALVLEVGVMLLPSAGLVMLTAIGGVLAATVYARELALRLGQPRLVRAVMVTGVADAVIGVLAVPCMVLPLLQIVLPLLQIALLLLFEFLAFLTFGVMTFVLMILFRIHLRRALVIARQVRAATA